ncbi:hypothetical protein U1Q18_013903 [Sarracenia purpurea var. burkii]
MKVHLVAQIHEIEQDPSNYFFIVPKTKANLEILTWELHAWSDHGSKPEIGRQANRQTRSRNRPNSDILQPNLTGVIRPISFTSDKSIIHHAYGVVNVVDTDVKGVATTDRYVEDSAFSYLERWSHVLLYDSKVNRIGSGQEAFARQYLGISLLVELLGTQS